MPVSQDECVTFHRPVLGLNEAAAATGAARRTISRMLGDGRIIGAEKIDGRWRIPVESLLAAGLKLHEPTQEVVATTAVVEGQAVRLATLEAEAVKDREIIEALRANVEDLRRSLRMLEPGALVANPPPHLEIPAPVMPPKRSHWWTRH